LGGSVAPKHPANVIRSTKDTADQRLGFMAEGGYGRP